MAGPDTKVSERNITTTTTGGYIHIILPDGGGGWESYRILASTFVQSSDEQIDDVTNRATDYSFALNAGVKFHGIDFEQVNGNPQVKIGTSSGGDELSLTTHPVPSEDYLILDTPKIMVGTTTIYVGISGGTVNMKIRYRDPYF
jgi:hypothetical protein